MTERWVPVDALESDHWLVPCVDGVELLACGDVDIDDMVVTTREASCPIRGQPFRLETMAGQLLTYTDAPDRDSIAVLEFLTFIGMDGG